MAKVQKGKKVVPKGNVVSGKSRFQNQPVSQLTLWGPFILLGLTGLVWLNARLRLLAIPLERDEGSFAYIGHWLLHGKDLYTDMLDSKLPGLYSIYALSTTLFGYNATGVHIGLMLLNAAAAVSFFLLLRDMFNSFVACVATAFFLILTLSPNVVGFAAHATQLLLPFVIGGCYLFWRAINSKKLSTFFLAGLLIGIAFTIKQQAALFGVLIAVMWWLLRYSWPTKNLKANPIKEWLWLGIGGFLPLIMTIGYFSITGRLEEFVFWTYEQPIALSQEFTQPWYRSMWEGIKTASTKFEMVWLAALLGLFVMFYCGFRKEHSWFGVLFTLIGLGSVIVGVGYYKHYFVTAMPGIALGCGITAYWISRRTGQFGSYFALAISFMLLILPLVSEADYYFKPDYAKIHQQAYNQNMFPEIEAIGKELSSRVPEGGRIAVLGSEPELLVAAQREGCSKYLMVYSMLIDSMNAQRMQDEYFHDISTCDADYVVFDIFSSSWIPGFENLPLHQKNMEWIKANWILEGVAEFREGFPGLILWGEVARKHSPQSPYQVYVFKRKE